MKIAKLHAIAHNYAESLASGLGFVVGYCPVNVFEEAACNSEASLEIDFLSGKIGGSEISEELIAAVVSFKAAFPSFCEKNGADISSFASFTTRFIAARPENLFIVTVQDNLGRKSDREYQGMPGKRVMVIDELGRVRPKVIQTKTPHITARRS